MIGQNAFLFIISGRGSYPDWSNNCECLGKMRAFLFLHAIRIKRRKIGRDCGRIKGKVFNYKIQVYLIGKFIDN